MTEEWICPFCLRKEQQEISENRSPSFPHEENDSILTFALENGKEEMETQIEEEFNFTNEELTF